MSMLHDNLATGQSKSLVDVEFTINKLVWDDYTHMTGSTAYPKTLSVDNYYSNGIFNGSSLNKLLTAYIKEVIAYKKKDGTMNQLILSDLNKQVFVVNNKIFNMCYKDLLPYLSSMDITDLIEVQSNTELIKVMEEVNITKSVQSIDKAYDVLEDILMNDPSLADNTVAMAFKGKTVNPRQLRLMLGPIGYKTDIDSSIFKLPITTSFTQGMDNIYAATIESRSAAKALYFSKKAIAGSETFAKHLQLLMMPITRVIFTDCGSTKYRKFLVRPKGHPSLLDGASGDLKNLQGKYFKLHPDDKELRVITTETNDIEGKYIYLRAADKCTLENPHHVCSVCAGDIVDNMPVGSNLGHWAAIAIMKQMSQSILSIKHLTVSAVAADAILEKEDMELFSTKGPGYFIDLDKLSKYDKVIVKIAKEDGFSIKAIRNKNDFQKVSVDRATNIKQLAYELHKGDNVTRGVMKVGTAHRTGRLSLRFLQYILQNKYKLDAKGNYIIDITKWKNKSQFMYLPEVEFSYFTLFLEASSLIKKRSVLKGGRSKDTPDTLAHKVFDLLNTKLNINMTYVEMIIYALTAKDLPNGDVSLGRNVEDPQLISLATAIMSRGQGAATAYGITKRKAVAPEMFLPMSGVDHPLDVIFKPVETLDGFDRESLWEDLCI